VTASYTYDALNRLTGLTQTLGSNTLHSYAYTLAPTGNRLRVVEDTGRSVSYSYDAALQLTAEMIDDPGSGTTSTSYAYDAAGNRVSRTGPSGTTTYAYDFNSRLLNAGPTSFTYDNNGNTLSQIAPGSTTAYQYDGLNRLVKAASADGVTSYAYDAAGNRVQTQSPTGTTNYLVDPFGADRLAQVLRETDANGAPLVDYVYASSELLNLTTPAGPRFRLADGQRSTRQLTDADGSITDTYACDAFGNLLTHTGTTPNNYLYAGQQFDPRLGAYYLRARYYAPSIGRFLTTDPLPGSRLNPKSLQRYTYAANDPVNGWDPSGRQTNTVEIQVVAAEEGELEGIEAGVDLNEGAIALEEGVLEEAFDEWEEDTIVEEMVFEEDAFEAEEGTQPGMGAPGPAGEGAGPADVTWNGPQAATTNEQRFLQMAAQTFDLRLSLGTLAAESAFLEALKIFIDTVLPGKGI
jgi:RHS repeat-associated protein